MLIRKNIASVALLIAVSALLAAQACAAEPEPTATSIPTQVPAATNTPIPEPTDTPAPAPTDTPAPVPTETPYPAPTTTPVPTPADTPIPNPTVTPVPEPTNAPAPPNTPEPTDTPIPEPTSTPIPQATNTPVPPPTTAPEPTPMLVETVLTVDEYLEVCSSLVASAAATGVSPEITNGELSEMIGNYHMLFSELNPPAEIGDWHNLQLDIWMSMRDALDRQPKDDPVNPVVLLEPVFANIEAAFSLEISQELMDRLNAAGCTGNFVDLEGMTTEEPTAAEPQPSVKASEATSPEILAEVEAFAAGCAGFGTLAAGPPAGATWGETSEGVGSIIEVLGALDPPNVLSDWHSAQLALFEGVKEIADAEPANDPLDQTKLFALIPYFQAVEAALGELPADVEAILINAACIDE